LNGRDIPTNLVVGKESAHQSEKLGEWKKYDCGQCNKTVNGQHEWEAHLKSKGIFILGIVLKSKGHKAAVRKRKRIVDPNVTRNST
jgi:hypothetical protein